MKVDSTVILCISRCKYKEQYFVDNHCHNFYHLIYITGGRGVIAINGVDHPSADDDAYLIAPGVFHELRSDVNMPLRTLEAKFIVGEPELDMLLQSVPLPFRAEPLFIRSLLDEMVREALQKSPLYKEMIFSRCLQLLFHIARLYSADSTSPVAPSLAELRSYREGRTETFLLTEAEPDKGSALTEQVLQYIHQHYCDQLSLSQLASHFAVSQSHLSKLFSHRYDIAPMQYVNNLKLQKVKNLLVHSNLSITDISNQVGFSSIHYLSRYFTQREQMSPNEYRHRFQDTVHISVEETYRIVNRKAIMR